MPNLLAASSNAIWALRDHLPMGLAFGMVDAGGVDEDTEDISLHPHSSTIGMHSSDDSDNESSEFAAFRCLSAKNVAENAMILWPHCTIIAKSATKNAMQWSKNHYARSLMPGESVQLQFQ